MQGYHKQLKQAVQVDFHYSSGIAIAGKDEAYASERNGRCRQKLERNKCHMLYRNEYVGGANKLQRGCASTDPNLHAKEATTPYSHPTSRDS